jgi:uncharacterized protein Yka (UPF0111/DUF47 family)
MVPLLPRDEKFYEMMSALATTLTRSSQLLVELLGDPARAGELIPAIQQVESGADVMAHDVYVRLAESFVPPLDPEDLYAVAQRIDHVVDLVEDAAESIAMFHLAELDESARHLAAVLHQACNVIARSVQNLREPESLRTVLAEMRGIEEAGEALYEQIVTELFAAGADPVDVIKHKALYDKLIAPLHECRAAGDVLESIALKNS